jgi:penicillin-binding protein 2
MRKAKPYTLNDEIGKAGIERKYEDVLRGKPGLRRLEVDADGDPVRVISDDPPTPGDDVVLNLDVTTQVVTEQALKSGLDASSKRSCNGCAAAAVGAVGSTVVIDPNNGGVLAMASFPNFAPADYTDGISQSEWAYLNDPVNHFPLNNWALQGQYAPGSTLKPFTAVAGLRAGLITPEKTVYDDGVYEVPDCKGDSCRFRNDASKAFGTVNLRRSLTVSSDFYYYDVGARFWIQQDAVGGPERFADLLKEWGFDKRTGIDLPSEQPGRIPSPAWLSEYCAQITCADDSSHWRTGKNVNMAIGQGEDLVTPLQLASAYATLANGGTRWKPQMVREVRKGQTDEVRQAFAPEAVGSVDMQPAWRQAILEGLVGVTTQDGGTAVGAFQGFPNAAFPIAAKTGTAQVSKKAPTAVFGAFGPATAPQFAVSVMMEESGYGGSAAAPVARRIFDVLSGFKPAPAATDADATAADINLLPTPGDVRD